jgi:hypothetical protein
MSIHITNFVRRQTAESHFSHWTISDEELVNRVSQNIDKAHKGYRDGVILVPVSPEGFFSAVAELQTSDTLNGSFSCRRAGEEPRKSVFMIGNKAPAQTVWVVLYAHHVLAEKNENESNADYEIVSINTSTSVDEKPAPMPPETLIANHFELSGGTATNMTDSEFVASLRESVMYWKDKVQVQPNL